MKKFCFTISVLFFLAACEKEANQCSNDGTPVHKDDQAKTDAGRPFVVTLAGANERPGPGDPDGSGTAILRLNQGQGTISFEISVANITLPATAAHIHVGSAAVAGPVVVGLAGPDITGTSSGVVTVAEDLIKAIRQNPENYYVNVHTLPLYAAGAVRGQLSK